MPPTSEIAPFWGSLSDRRLRDGLGDVGRVFFDFPVLSDIQRSAVPLIAEGHNVLVCAATATGKTEAVVAPLVWRLRRNSVHGNGPRLLAVAPTRALVADLLMRLEPPLAQLGWRCAAQTSDFRGKAGMPEVLITTPESFDSMLVRDAHLVQGEPVGHLLLNVGAVFVDEAHCFDSTARGDQVVFLLARLRLLRERNLVRKANGDTAIQVCAASATVFSPQPLATRLLGPGSLVVVCPGSRPIEILSRTGTWQRIDTAPDPAAIARDLPIGAAARFVASRLWQGLETGECRKALIFVPSRKQCDLLSRELGRQLTRRRAFWVGAHHGSLSRETRQNAEACFRQNRDSVLVATNTLEVGVDIGDVDIIVLVGAPPDTASLLQRIGRGGRRSGLTRIVTIARNKLDLAALASELLCAARGDLDVKYRLSRWDVFPQQVISYIRQNQGQGRPIGALCDLAASAWPSPNTRSLATDVIQHWLSDGRLIEQRGRLHLGPEWDQFSAHSDGDFLVHSNIKSGMAAIAIRDQFTGEIIGHSAKLAEDSNTVTIAGKQHRIVSTDEGIVVSPAADGDSEVDDTPNYGGRRRPNSEVFAVHVRRGLGLEEQDAPWLACGAEGIWFHFGGEVFEACVRLSFPDLVIRQQIPGVSLKMGRPIGRLALGPNVRSRLEAHAGRLMLMHIEAEGAGRHASDIPESIWLRVESECGLLAHFEAWLGSRICTEVHSPELKTALLGLL